MMVEPPRDIRVGGVFEIDNGVLVAIEESVGELLAGLMRHPREMKVSAGLNALTEKTIKYRRRCRAVEASVVKTQANFDRFNHYRYALHSAEEHSIYARNSSREIAHRNTGKP